MTHIVAALLALLLVAVAAFFLVRQRRAIERVRHYPEWSDAERSFLAAQARRRIVCSILLVLFAGFLIGWIFLEPVWLAPLPENDNRPDRDLVQAAVAYWAVALVLLLIIMLLAFLDFWATARYGLRQHRQLMNDHQELLKYRPPENRNGHGG